MSKCSSESVQWKLHLKAISASSALAARATLREEEAVYCEQAKRNDSDQHLSSHARSALLTRQSRG